MLNKLVEIVKECYPTSDVLDADFYNGQLRIVSKDGDVRWYGFDGDRLYCYRPESITEPSHIRKFKTIFREAKINQIIE